MNRRNFLTVSAAAVGATFFTGVPEAVAGRLPPPVAPAPPQTLLQMADAVMGKEPLRGEIIEFLARPDLLNALEFTTVEHGQPYKYADETRAPEQLRIAGGDIDVDPELVHTHGPQLLSMRRRMASKELSLWLVDMMVNGDPARDPREVKGLKKRARVVANDGKPLTTKVLDAAIESVPGAAALLMNKPARNRLSTMSREFTSVDGPQVIWDKDQYGNRKMFYRTASGVQVHVMVTDYNHENLQVIDFNETIDGAAYSDDDCTSIYVLRLGADGLRAGQNGIPEVDAFGVVSIKPPEADDDVQVDRTRVEWLVTLADEPDAIVRLTGVPNQPFTVA